LESAEAKPVLGTEGAIDPFFSPDGHWLGFFGNGKLTKVSVSGGAPIVLSEVAASPRGASWSGQGTIVFNPLVSGSLQQVPDGGGSLQVLTHPETGDTGHRWPHLLPNGRALLFAGGTTSNPRIAVYSLTSGEQRQLIQRARAQRSPSSRIFDNRQALVPHTTALQRRDRWSMFLVVRSLTSGSWCGSVARGSHSR
jgi:hypothetical protein